MRAWQFCFIAAEALLAGACSLEPAYQRPAAPVPGSFPQTALPATRAATGGVDAAAIGWRDFFTDPRLQQLIALALQNNRDLRVAALNVQAAQAQYRIQRADLFPSVAAAGGADVQRYAQGVADTGPGGQISRTYQVGVGFTSYELDLFGRVRSLDHAALEQYFSYEETRRSTQLSLVAEVADAYLTVLADEAQLKLAGDTLRSQSGSLDLLQKSFDLGAATELSLRQAETTVDSAKASAAVARRQLAQDRNALQLLVGAVLPDGLPPELDFGSADFVAAPPSTLPSEVLTRRPDVLAAEHRLKAANADIGAARAAFFPSISLTGSFGAASSQLDGLFKDGAESWIFSPQISVPIFAGGANAANLDLAKIRKRVEVAQYEKAIQSAFREVADALDAVDALDEQLAAQQALVKSSGAAYRLSELRFQHGVDSYLTVLDAQRSLFAAQQTLLDVKLARLQNLVTLYKALGGGVSEHAELAGKP
jgi:multidrug efflux system outer membrane protein